MKFSARTIIFITIALVSVTLLLGTASTPQSILAAEFVATSRYQLSSYQPPIGIPAPSFGIDESAPPQPDAWPGAQVAGYYYIDNTHPNATDSDNQYGYPNKPRETIPEITYGAGSYVEIHGGDYADEDMRLDFLCTSAAPCWMRGTAAAMPKISGQIISYNNLSYVIFEYLDFDGGGIGSLSMEGAADHVAFRHSFVRNKPWINNSAGIGFVPGEGKQIHDILIYNNRFHDLGDWQTTEDQDFHGIVPSLWGRDRNSGSEVYNIWILENSCYHLSGDCVQVNAGFGEGAGELLHHIYIGKNVSYENRQAGFWSKQARDVIISQNVAYGGHGGSGGPGDGIGYQYNPDNLWILYNDLYDNNFGIRQGSTDGDGSEKVYIIGNVIHDNVENLDPCGHWSSPSGWAISLWYGGTRYIVNNTIYNTRGGIELINGGDSAPTFILNNIIADLNGMDYENDDPACGSHTVAPDKVEHFSTNNVTSVTLDQNLFVQRDNHPVKISGYRTLADYQTMEQACTHCLERDPRFVDPANGNFNLHTDSPAIDRGIAVDVYQQFQDRYGLDIRVDYESHVRPQGEGWDIGAFEVVRATTPFTPTESLYLPIILQE